MSPDDLSLRLGILAHQGGWDEILMVAVPILVILGVLRVVKKRVDAGSFDEHPDLRTPRGRSGVSSDPPE